MWDMGRASEHMLLDSCVVGLGVGGGIPVQYVSDSCMERVWTAFIGEVSIARLGP